VIKPDSPGFNLGVAQRYTFDDNGRQTVILLAGIGTNGTLAAVQWFISNWERLPRMVGERDFGVCLQCPKRIKDPDGYLKYTLRRHNPEGVFDNLPK
jgi:hypothetical protein